MEEAGGESFDHLVGDVMPDDPAFYTLEKLALAVDTDAGQ
jgi:hypothetical protein